MLLVVIAILSLLGSLDNSRRLNKSNAELRHYVQCQQQWNGFLYISITRGREASTAATQALDELIDAVTQAKSPADTRAALEKYKAARTNQNQVATDNPLPPPPEEVCEV
jgi:hypothetical protein